MGLSFIMYVLEVLSYCLSKGLTCKMTGETGNCTSIATVLDLIQARGGMWKTFDNV